MPDTVMTMEAPGFRNRSASIASLAGALAEAQKNFASIPKDREVTVTSDRGSYKFKYATLDAIMGATMPALSDQGLAISQALTEWGTNFAVETTLYHKSGEWISNVTPMFLAGRRTKEGRDLPPGNQELGSAQTYARRYGYSALLCITADEDDDGNHADGNHATGERIPFKPGARGSAGAGTQFRPERRSPGMAQTESLRVDPADRGMVKGNGESQYEADKAKKAATAAPLGGVEATAENARKLKIKAATDKRVDALKSAPFWTHDGLDQFHKDNKAWVEWMKDPANSALEEFDRYVVALDEARRNVKPVELA